MMSALGDAVQTLPVINALRRTFPGAHISWLLQPGPYQLVRHHPSVDRFLLFARRRGLGAWEPFMKTARTLRVAASEHEGGRFDLLLALQVYFKAGLLTALAPARIKVGFDFHRARDLNWLFTTHRIPPHPALMAHTQDQYFEFLRFLGIEAEPLEYGLRLTDEEKEAQRTFFSTLGQPACSVVVGTSDPRKNWTPVGYSRVLDSLEGELGLHPFLLAGPSRTDQWMVKEIMTRTRSNPRIVMGDGIRRLLWLLEGSALVISPDTGPLHMARALDVPVIGLFGYTNPRRSGPYRRFTDLVVDGYRRSSQEAPDITREKRAGGMSRITPQAVLEKVRLALDRYVRTQP
jgi:heptosyltransferase I